MLTGQNLIVIGASGAIGGCFLDAALTKGASCVSLGRHPPNRSDVTHIDADITSLQSLQRAAEVVFEKHDRIDTILNFAGTHHKPMDFINDDPAVLEREFERVIRVNLSGAFLVTLVFGRVLISQRHGHLIHLCSNASRLSLYGSYGYNASKHGLEGLIKTAAAQFAPYRVRVNGVAPGTVETPLNRHLLREGDSKTLSPRAASILAHTPTKRFATLAGIAETLLATCLPQRHLTGNIVFCDDGYNIEGHSWPEGNLAVYGPGDAIDELYCQLDGDLNSDCRY